MIAFFSVHCSKKKGGGLGLGILALAGGGGSSSSSSGDSTDKPKDDPNNDPEFDEVKKKIESTIKFPKQNENKILKNNNDYKSVDLSITGEFFEDLKNLKDKNLKDLEVEHQASTGEKKTIAKTIPITESFITNKKIPLVLDLSSIQPDTGFTQPKLKLKFSADDKQIILKEWTQNFFLEGKKQTPIITYKDKNDKEKTVENILITDESLMNDISDDTERIPVKVSVPKGIPQKIETRIEAKALSWNTGPHNATFSPSLSAPARADGIQNFKEFDFDDDINYTIASQLFYRLKGTKDWKSTTPFINYYSFYDSALKAKVNKLLIKKGEKLTITFTTPDSDKTLSTIGLLGYYGGGSDYFLGLSSDGSDATDNTMLANRVLSKIADLKYKTANKDYTIDITFENNIEKLETIKIEFAYDDGSEKSLVFKIKIDTKN